MSGKVNYEKLIEYITYFDNDNNEYYGYENHEYAEDDSIIRMPYPKYDEKLLKFIDEVEKTEIMRQDYLEFLERNFGREYKFIEKLETADFETLRCILTYYVRQERYCTGLWGTAAKEGIFLKILRQLKMFR